MPSSSEAFEGASPNIQCCMNPSILNNADSHGLLPVTRRRKADRKPRSLFHLRGQDFMFVDFQVWPWGPRSRELVLAKGEVLTIKPADPGPGSWATRFI